MLLDLMMPEMDGWEVCKQLRKTSDVPIIMLTARDDDIDKVVGLELGADDYVTKPFNPRELVARVKAVLRRTERGSEPTRVIRFQDLTIDLDRREFRIGERLVDLRPKEFDLLVDAGVEPGRRVRPRAPAPGSLGLRLRRRLAHRRRARHLAAREARHQPGRIQTVWSVGYKLVTADQLPARAASGRTRARPDAPGAASARAWRGRLGRAADHSAAGRRGRRATGHRSLARRALRRPARCGPG